MGSGMVSVFQDPVSEPPPREGKGRIRVCFSLPLRVAPFTEPRAAPNHVDLLAEIR